MDAYKWTDVQAVVNKINPTFKQISAKYKPLKPFMVFCRLGSQAAVDSSHLAIVMNCPDMVVDSRAKNECLELGLSLKMLEEKKEDKARITATTKQIAATMINLRYHPETQIELRFDNLKYEMIRDLQNDPLIDLELTMRRKASIRIIMTSLEKTIGV